MEFKSVALASPKSVSLSVQFFVSSMFSGLRSR
jgi:hypothetical protein